MSMIHSTAAASGTTSTSPLRMEPLTVTASRALRQLLARQPASEAKLAFAWNVAAGNYAARATEAVALDGTTLKVRVQDIAWARELGQSRAVLIERLAGLLGAGVVTAIDIRTGDGVRQRPAPCHSTQNTSSRGGRE